jgi:glycosyltransferase involved in cell wall biosynthesis
MPLVSVIIPAHNEADVIDRAIESVRTQTLEDFELIVVDDCSDDGTADIASSYDDPRMEVICHSNNRGGGPARNTGIMNAEGRYLAFLDADDEWYERKLEVQHEHLSSMDDSHVGVYCAVHSTNNWGPVASAVYEQVFETLTPPDEGGSELIPHVLSREFPLGGSSTLFIRADTVKQMGGFDSEFDRHQDIEFLIRLLKTGKLAYVDKELMIKHDTGTPSPDTIRDAKIELFEKFQEEIRAAQQNGFPVVKNHRLSLARHYAHAGREGEALRVFRTVPDRTLHDYVLFSVSLTRGRQ